MIKSKRIISLMLVALMAFGAFAGCSKNDSTKTDGFDYSKSLTDEGFYKDVDPVALVTLPEYKGIKIPADAVAVKDEEISSQLSSILTQFNTKNEIKDREVKDGDTLNIDYVGKVDGKEFDGGSTDGKGTDVTIGVTQYVDNFLEQLIGHKPGDKFDVNVTFPADYSKTELQGKAAVFAVTINHIIETVTPDLTDAFVKEKLSDKYSSVSDMTDKIRQDIARNKEQSYLWEQITSTAQYQAVPESVSKFEQDVMIDYYKSMATQMGIDFKTYLSYMQVESEEALIAKSQEELKTNSEHTLLVQAIAKKEGLSVTDDDIKAYFKTDDIKDYVDHYGKPYLKLAIMQSKVLTFVGENAIK